METDLKISVDPASVNEFIAKKLLESTLGDRLNELVEQAIKDMGSYSSNPLKSAISAEINKALVEYVREKYSEKIKAFVDEKMTDEFISSMVTGFMSTLTNKVDRF